jgi:hypothetical protein
MEAEVVTGADRVITVSPTWKKNFEATYKRSVDLLTNGFDFAHHPRFGCAHPPNDILISHASASLSFNE